MAMNPSLEQEIREKYGDLPLTSDPVNPDNPTFSSLLGALKAVHSGEMGMEVLAKYHQELTKQLKENRKELDEMEVHESSKEMKDISRGSLDIVQVTMDLIEGYISEPTDDNMAKCIDSFLTSRSITEYVRNMLDKNISNAKLDE
jgi:hypothetical protein